MIVDGFGGLSCNNDGTDGVWTPSDSLIVIVDGVVFNDPDTSWTLLAVNPDTGSNPSPGVGGGGTGGWATISVNQLREGDIFSVRFTHNPTGSTAVCSYLIPPEAAN